MKDAQNYPRKGKRPNFSGYRIKAKYVNGDNLNNFRPEASRYFKKKVEEISDRKN
jgi:hypothetical protein